MKRGKPFKLSIVLSCQETEFHAATLKGNLDQNLQFLSGLGYQGVELAIRDPSKMDYIETYTLLNKWNMTVPAIGTGQAWGEDKLSFTDIDKSIRTQAVERIQAHIPSAAHLNAVIIIGLIRGITQPEIDREQSLNWMIEGLKTCALAAAEQGVSLCIEPINRYETDLINNVAEGLQIIDQNNLDNVGLLLDTFHMNIEEVDISQSIKNAGEKIFHFHVADSNRWYPGAGHMDFHNILSTLKETGYSGFVSGEFIPEPDPETSSAKGIKHLSTLQN